MTCECMNVYFFLQGSVQMAKHTNDLALAKEVACRKQQTHQDWDEIATVLSEVFSSDSNRVELKGRGCQERLVRLIENNEQDHKKSLKK